MRRLLLCALLLGACAKEPKFGGNMEKGLDVFKGSRKVLWIKNEPGPLISTAVLPPGAKPATHPFLTGRASDPSEENKLGTLLGQAKNFEEYVQLLEKAGYSVAPAKP